MQLSLCFACLICFLGVQGWRKGKPFLWVLALCLVGNIFVFINAPNPRFGAGYLAFCPALFVAVAGPDLEGWAKRYFTGWTQPIHSFSIASILLEICALLALQTGWNDLKMMRKVEQFAKSPAPSESHSWRRLLLPPTLPKFPGDIMVIERRGIDRIWTVQLTYERSNGIEYSRSIGTDQCWAVPLPCLEESLEGDVSLRSPESGFRSGFARTASPETAQQVR
jgi:hypothetical protein